MAAKAAQGTDGFLADVPLEFLVPVLVLAAGSQMQLIGIPHAIGLYYTLTVELVFYTLCAVLFAAGYPLAAVSIWMGAVAGFQWVPSTSDFSKMWLPSAQAA